MKLYLQMLNDTSVKRSWDSLRCKYQLKQITKTTEKIVGTNEKCILRKMSLKFQNLILKFFCKIAFWTSKSSSIRSWFYGESCPGKNATCFVGQLWKMINFICKKSFYCMEQTQPIFTVPRQLCKDASPLPWNANPGRQVCQKG